MRFLFTNGRDYHNVEVYDVGDEGSLFPSEASAGVRFARGGACCARRIRAFFFHRREPADGIVIMNRFGCSEQRVRRIFGSARSIVPSDVGQWDHEGPERVVLVSLFLFLFVNPGGCSRSTRRPGTNARDVRILLSFVSGTCTYRLAPAAARLSSFHDCSALL